ncbi:MAG: hypothetical protein ACK4NC_04840 [Candidatus Gracilibacteria bacterium]
MIFSKQSSVSGEGSLTQQTQQGDNYSYNNCTFSGDVKHEQEDYGIIQEILVYALSNISEGENPIDGYLKLRDKIQLNFPSEDEQKIVNQYLTCAYIKYPAIQEQIKLAGPEVEIQLQTHIFRLYRKLFKEGKNNIDILEELFDNFVLVGKKQNPAYTQIAQAFVLFFFDDCTIFEKTPQDQQLTLSM